MSFAIIETGGKQYKVAKNDVLKLEKVPGEAGSVVLFDEVLAVTDEKGKVTLGSPIVKDVKGKKTLYISPGHLIKIKNVMR